MKDHRRLRPQEPFAGSDGVRSGPRFERTDEAQETWLTPRAAAERLHITVTTLYDWLGQSDWGLFQIRGQSVTIDYLQGGPRGRGRIRIPAEEVRRLLDLMRVRPKPAPTAPRTPPQSFPGITVPLGRLPS